MACASSVALNSGGHTGLQMQLPQVPGGTGLDFRGGVERSPGALPHLISHYSPSPYIKLSSLLRPVFGFSHYHSADSENSFRGSDT